MSCLENVLKMLRYIYLILLMFCYLDPGERLLQFLIKSNNAEMILDCISRNPRLDQYLTEKAERDNTFLYYAIEHYSDSMITGLLNYMIEMYSSTKLEGIFQYEPGLLKYLTTCDDRGYTPMHAVMQTDLDVREKVEILIRNRCADTFRVKNYEDLTPIQLGMKRFSDMPRNKKTLVDAVSCYLDHVTPSDIFHDICDVGSSQAVEELLKKGADPYSLDDKGVAAITTASLSNFEPRQKLRSLQNADVLKVTISTCEIGTEPCHCVTHLGCLMRT